jgi:hypothetical protein
MRWRTRTTHKLVAADDVHRLTGMSVEELLLQRDTQRLVRIDANGGRHEFLRIPVELLSDEASDRGDLDG